MSTSIDFIKQYGDRTFDELPFCDVDNIAFCEIFYMPFEKVIYDRYDREPIPFKEACDKMFAYNGFKHVAHSMPENWGYADPVLTDKWIRTGAGYRRQYRFQT